MAELLLLGALWGASFLFMRISAPEFGPAALVFLRVGGAALLLLPLALLRGQGAALRRHAPALLVLGLINSALPFALFMVAALALGAGLMAVFNATTPLWTAALAWAWLGERPAGLRIVGLATGLAGVLLLAGSEADLRPGAHGISPAWAVAACLLAAALYAWAALHARRRLAGVPPLAVAAGSQVAAALLTLPTAWWLWPAQAPSAGAWASTAALALVCTGLAYLLFFRLIANAGATTAVSVTFLIPGFAMAWGWLLLGEQPTPTMLAGCAVILLGTALSTGLLAPGRRQKQ